MAPTLERLVVDALTTAPDPLTIHHLTHAVRCTVPGTSRVAVHEAAVALSRQSRVRIVRARDGLGRYSLRV